VKYISIVTCALLFAGCTHSSETIQHGSTKFLLTQTQNQWADNVVLVSECEQDLANGMCKPKDETKEIVTSGKLPGVLDGAAQSVTTWGAAASLRDGLVKGEPKVNNSNTTNEHFSTKYIGK